MKSFVRYSELFGKTFRQPPKDESSRNAQLLEQAGFISKLMAGVYTYLPLGLRVLNAVKDVIRREMDALGAQEFYMPALQPKEIWEKTGRWKDLSDIMYQFPDHSGRQVGLAATHEEVITHIVKQRITSYKDLPLALYQIQDKFRDEPRAKSGLIRGREFSMKDLYSFHADEKDLDSFYNRVAASYLSIFSRLGLQALMIEAAGGSFTKRFSDEFQVISDAGEDRIIYCPSCHFAQNSEIAEQKAGGPCPKCHGSLSEKKGIEVGNIFKLGTKFSDSIGATFTASDGSTHPLIMASYGIGPGRLVGTIVEVSNDAQGIIWPKSVTPFQIHLVQLSKGLEEKKKTERLVHDCLNAGLTILLDDRVASAGVKFKDADMVGITARMVISTSNENQLEVKIRNESASKKMNASQAIEFVKNYYAE